MDSRIVKWVAVISFLVNFVSNFIPGQSVLGEFGATPFSPNKIFFVIFWVVLYVLQIAYLYLLFYGVEDVKKVAVGVSLHFIAFELLEYGWSALWVHSQLWVAEIFTLVNLVQIGYAYIRHRVFTPRTAYFFVHAPVLALPSVYLLEVLFWNGSAAVHAHHLAARLFANISIWTLLVIPGAVVITYKDWVYGLAASFIMAGLGVGQFFLKVVALQWIFAFTIMGVLFVLSVLVAVPLRKRPTEEEQAPLLTS